LRSALKKIEEGLDACREENAGGDKNVFAELYEKCMPRVFRYIYYRIGDMQQAEDLTSMVFEKALTGFGGYRPQKASMPTWLFAIARNAVIDYWRRAEQPPDGEMLKLSETNIGTLLYRAVRKLRDVFKE